MECSVMRGYIYVCVGECFAFAPLALLTGLSKGEHRRSSIGAACRCSSYKIPGHPLISASISGCALEGLPRDC